MNPATWLEGLKKIPRHLYTWGLAFAALALLLGWYAVVAVLAIRLKDEIVDVFFSKTDTLAKGAIDVAASVVPAVLVVLARMLFHR